MADGILIQGKGICKSYDMLNVLQHVDVCIRSGEIVSITGPSGAGKSTLLHILGTLDRPDSGELEIEGQRITAFSDARLAKIRNQRIGFVFQFHHLLPEFTALENVCMPAFIGGLNKQKAEQKAKELLHTLGLSNRCNHKPAELSGGEQQRVAVARALINDPAIVLADEPSGNLDTQNAHTLHELFFSLRSQFQQTFVIVTHNQELAQMSDRCIALRDGKIVAA